jgi:acyl carrier protein
MNEGIPLHPSRQARAIPMTAFTPVEQTVAHAFEAVLGVPVTARDVDFFELGGDSYLAVTAGLLLEDAFRIELPVDLLEEVTTVSGVAAWIEARR